MNKTCIIIMLCIICTTQNNEAISDITVDLGPDFILPTTFATFYLLKNKLPFAHDAINVAKQLNSLYQSASYGYNKLNKIREYAKHTASDKTIRERLAWCIENNYTQCALSIINNEASNIPHDLTVPIKYTITIDVPLLLAAASKGNIDVVYNLLFDQDGQKRKLKDNNEIDTNTTVHIKTQLIKNDTPIQQPHITTLNTKDYIEKIDNDTIFNPFTGSYRKILGSNSEKIRKILKILLQKKPL